MNISLCWFATSTSTPKPPASRALEVTMVNTHYSIVIYNILSHHDTTQRTHARLFLQRGDAFLPSFPQLSEEYQFDFEFEFN